MKRLFSTLLMAAAMACLLTGCLFKGSDQLYVLPKLSADYTELQEVLEQIVSSGLEYAAAKSGENTQSIQFLDLNRDWIVSHLQQAKRRLEAHPEPTAEEEQALRRRAHTELPPLCA